MLDWHAVCGADAISIMGVEVGKALKKIRDKKKTREPNFSGTC